MMNFEHIHMDLNKAPIAYLYLDKPELHNAFDDKMVADLTHALSFISTKPEFHLLVLAAKGKTFCAGADLAWMQRMATYQYEENYQDAKAMANMFRSLADFPLPTIAMVHGPAFGGGVGLIAACDIAIASDNVTFCLSEVKLGLIPAVISPFLLNTIGQRALKRYALTAEIFTAHEAKNMGLVHEVITSSELEARVSALCKQMLNNSPHALKAAKHLIDDISEVGLENAIEHAVEAIANIRVSPEGQAGLRAFLEKKPAPWLPRSSSTS